MNCFEAIFNTAPPPLEIVEIKRPGFEEMLNLQVYGIRLSRRELRQVRLIKRVHGPTNTRVKDECN